MKTAQHKTTKLFCFDFDQTIIKIHFNPILDPKEEIRILLNDKETGIKNPEKLLKTFKKILENGYKIAITSYTSYPEIIEPTLIKLGLTSEEIDQIYSVCFLPDKQDQINYRKQKHIMQAMEHFKIIDKADVWLIDDDFNNYNMAVENGFNAIQVPKNLDTTPEYLIKIDKVIADQYAEYMFSTYLKIYEIDYINFEKQSDGYFKITFEKDSEFNIDAALENIKQSSLYKSLDRKTDPNKLIMCLSTDQLNQTVKVISDEERKSNIFLKHGKDLKKEAKMNISARSIM